MIIRRRVLVFTKIGLEVSNALSIEKKIKLKITKNLIEMENRILNNTSTYNNHYLSEEDVNDIIKKMFNLEDIVIDMFTVQKASENMLGFLADYWKLRVQLIVNKTEKKTCCFFIKAISISNEAKANMVREMKLFDKESFFYSVIKSNLDFSGIRPWSAPLITILNEAMVFEDLNARQYKTRNKLEKFDKAHTFQALSTLARFHASSIIYEERKSELLKRKYCINEEFESYLNEGGYKMSDQWYLQCMTGALAAIKMFSKYRKDVELIRRIEDRWNSVWDSALKLCDILPDCRGVICHRDLWNNNLLFHYEMVSENKFIPDDCLMVDFQAVRYQEPAGDVMLLLYCNLDPIQREENMELFLNYYYEELKIILSKNGLEISEILSADHFWRSAEEQRLWGLIVSACLTPQMWLDDTLTTQIFCETEQFNQILSKDKGAFIQRMMQENQDYKDTNLAIFEEIVERYCLK